MNRRHFLISMGCSGIATISYPSVSSNSSVHVTSEPLDRRIDSLVNWIRRGFVAGDINLLSNLPSGRTHGGTLREDLKNLYWLQNCNLFGMHALRPYDPEMAESIGKSYRQWYKQLYPDDPERTEHYLPLGQLPGHKPPEGHYFRAIVKRVDLDGFTVGTETYDPQQTGRIIDTDPRSLLKFGAMGCWLRGDRVRAMDYFHKALALWDGRGFGNTRMDRHDAYYTRHLSYALIAEGMLQTRIPETIRKPLEQKLWACQDSDGGIWTNYMADGSFPHFAKKTNESGPLALLAYPKLPA